jgi:EAL domain-containing protein (putative c-di-GMP-specific phosphodiesterase class I)/DNA-binding response OmpR family regulator
MLAGDFEQLGAQRLRLFETQLPQRMTRLQARGARLRESGWDINTMAVLAADADLVSACCRQLDATALADALSALHDFISPLLALPRLPDTDEIERIGELLDALTAQALPRNATNAVVSGPGIVVTGPTHELGFPLLVTPPAGYWKRFGEPLPKRAAPIAPAPEAIVPLAAAPAAETESAIASVESIEPPVTAALRVHHLGSADDLAAAIDERLRARGYEVTHFGDTTSLLAAIEAAAPALILVDASFTSAIDDIGAHLKPLRKDSDHPIWLVALSARADVAARLHAVRVGCDNLIETPTSADEVVARIVELTEAEHGDPYRVMIIEDDRSQTMFAESILRKAGMLTFAVADALLALDELERFNPDLILMDLYMPGCDGIDLTALIRQRRAFMATPIVFLSGEYNADKRFEALHAGGDDFLSKPIRPRHLISAVTNRVRRTRQLRHRDAPAAISGSAVGVRLAARDDLLQRVSECLAMDDARSRAGGLLVFALENPQRQQARIGEAAFAALIREAGAFLITHAGARDLVAADGDGRILVFNPDCEANLLEAYALNLRERIARETFTAAAGEHIVFDVGVCPFVAGASQVERMRDTALAAIETARGAGARGVFMVRDVAAAENEDLIERIRTALEDGGFQLVFQPIVSLRGEEDEQFQALLRLHGEYNRVHTAAEVVPAAERAGLIDAVDRWVLHNCVDLIAARTRNGRMPRLFISLSLDSVRNPDNARWLADLLESAKVPGDAISLELRASEMLKDEEAVAHWSTAMSAIGASITVAGIEAGELGERLMGNPAIGYIKVAPRYLRFDDEAVRDELRALVELAHEHGKRVIAPRVEDARGAAALWTAGVDFIQGNFVQQAGLDLAFEFHASAL